MKSLLGALVRAPRNDSPVPYVGRSHSVLSTTSRHDPGSAIGAMAEVPALFPIVSGGANATSRTPWTLFRTPASGKEEDREAIPADKHLAIKLLNRPNDFMYGALLREIVQQHVELCGVGYIVVAKYGVIPYELWPVRPDRIAPVPDRDKFLSGYVYTAPDGEKVPLDADQVIPVRAPNPEDVYGGLSAVTPMMTDLDTARLSAAWNRNFFLNDASPGGVVLFEEELSDEQFRDFRERWRQQHQGVNNAGRVAMLENGAKWQDRAFSLRDMQFKEMRELSAEMVRRGFGYPKHLLGDADIGNRATAEAQNAMFGQWYVTPRLDRWKGALNHFYLPMFGPASKGVELDYDDPVPEDADAANAARDSKVAAVVALINAGADSAEVFEWAELPMFSFTKPEPKIVAPPVPPADKAKAISARAHIHEHHAWAMARPQNEAPGPPPDVDLQPVQDAYEEALTALLAAWGVVTDAQRDEIVRQVREVVDSGDLSGLASMTASSAQGAQILAEHMTELAAVAGAQVAAEAAEQGVLVAAAMPSATAVAAVASITAALLAAGLVIAAAREALRVHHQDSTGREVGEKVGDYLRELKGAEEKRQFGMALTGAQNGARLATFQSGPIAALYSDETLDKNTCKPCLEVNGRWLGNSDGVDFEQVEKTYPLSGYVGCVGPRYGNACRGTVVGVWRSKTA